MKIALAQVNYQVGDFSANTKKIIDAIGKAREAGAELVVFAELSVCGYPPRDFLEFSDFIERSRKAIEEIASVCHGIAAIVGVPVLNPLPKGKPLFNAAVLIENGKIAASAHKTLLPNYDVFDEYRYFEPNPEKCRIIQFHGIRIALTICEDLWNIAGDPLYQRNPMDEMAEEKPGLMINIAASPYNYEQPEIRKKILTLNTSRYGIPLVYVNQVGAQTELIFDGHSMVVDADGSVPLELPMFEEGLKFWDFHPEKAAKSCHQTTIFPENPAVAPHDIRNPFDAANIGSIHDALVLGIKDYFGKMGFSRAILGLSGGIDSALTLVLAARALGAENVKAILLPSQYSSNHSITDARELAENLEVPYEVVPIRESFESIMHTLEIQFSGLPFNLTEENIQARLRAVILMALSNKFGYILLNTSNKSEAAVGYGTLYGDMCGGLSVLGDVYKTQVYQLARYINRHSVIIPLSSITKPPSAELRPDQKDSDSLPEYDILDRLLYLYIEHRLGPDQLKAAGFNPALTDRVLKLVNTSEYKRHQSPPILRVSPKAFGQGRRMPIVGRYLS
jgi:NAD+ synthase (glutamine-hydrolysing)